MTVQEYEQMMKIGEITEKYNIHIGTDNNMFLVIDKEDKVLYACEDIESAFAFVEGYIKAIQMYSDKK